MFGTGLVWLVWWWCGTCVWDVMGRAALSKAPRVGIRLPLAVIELVGGCEPRVDDGAASPVSKLPIRARCSSIQLVRIPRLAAATRSDWRSDRACGARR